MNYIEDTSQGVLTPMPPQTGPLILGFRDVLLCILESSPFKDLSSFGATCTSGRDAAQAVMRLRLSRLVNSYIDGRLASFGRILTASDAVIAGSCVLWMLLAPDHWHPNNLNIVVPHGKTESLLGFFLALEYASHEESVYWQRRATVHKFRRLTRGRSIVTITESANDSVFPPILASSSTLDFNVLTMGSIACMYPALTLSNAGFACIGSRSSELTAQGPKGKRLGLYPYSVPWIGRCGYSCPTLSRRLYALEGSVVYNWPSGGQSVDSCDVRVLAGSSHYSWVVSSTCQNPFCEWQDSVF